MKIRFKNQPYQTTAVNAVADCFTGQPNLSNRMFPSPASTSSVAVPFPAQFDRFVFGNGDLLLPRSRILSNIQSVQKRQNLPVSERLISGTGCAVNLDIEMETGTGKTYCYIKTIFEMNKRYGWTKFIIVVPSVAIREGVLRSLDMTAPHFGESYGKRARFFSYNSRQLYPLESFSSDSGITIMVINIQAFNATGKDNRRIYEELEDFQSRRPIDVLRASRPILILDEPQKMEGGRTLEGLSRFGPLFILRYSATHRTSHNKVHRLDALDAYNRKLVKKISVRGVSVQTSGGMGSYLYLESIEVSTRHAPVARMEMEVRRGNGVTRFVKRLVGGADLHSESGWLEQYRGFVITQIDAGEGTVEFSNGRVLHTGEVSGDATEVSLRRIQIRETIRAHFEKERALFPLGVKTLSLFFIDEVAKYRDYGRADEQGDYARIFEKEYKHLKREYLESCLRSVAEGDREYAQYLEGIDSRATHSGYFSIDRKTNRITNPSVSGRGTCAGISDDADAYDLILRDKERLLSFEEPVRFIFSHSALREGWDNPNVFTLCMLKRGDSVISRRQEVGRGLRLSVNQRGERMDDPATVHEVNVLTVVAGESYRDFVSTLQKEVYEALSARPRRADVEYFSGKQVVSGSRRFTVTGELAEVLCGYLSGNGYVDGEGVVCASYYEAKSGGTLAALPEAFAGWEDGVFSLIEEVLSPAHIPGASNGRIRKSQSGGAQTAEALDKNVSVGGTWRVEFDAEEFVRTCIEALNAGLRVSPIRYVVQQGAQRGTIDYEDLGQGEGFTEEEGRKLEEGRVRFSVAYDLLGEICGRTELMRRTVADILTGIRGEVFGLYKENPEQFIEEAARLINECGDVFIGINTRESLKR